jgi:diguanylate cyclase (GGDEF)-like protein
VAAAAVAQAELAAQAVLDTQQALLLAARTVAEAAAEAARTVAEAAAASALAIAAAVDAKAVVVAEAAAAAAEARRREVSLTHDVLHDELTGLPTRRLLVDRLTQALARSRRTNTSIGVLFLDLDDFKSVNDTLGHAAGDLVLAGVGRRLRKSLRDSDTCARVGGDEFVVVAEDLGHPSYGKVIADRLQTALAAGVQVGELIVPVLVSVGIVLSNADSEPLELLEQADAAMYRAKRAASQRTARKR